MTCLICFEDAPIHKTCVPGCGQGVCRECFNGMLHAGRTLACPQCRSKWTRTPVRNTRNAQPRRRQPRQRQARRSLIEQRRTEQRTRDERIAYLSDRIQTMVAELEELNAQKAEEARRVAQNFINLASSSDEDTTIGYETEEELERIYGLEVDVSFAIV